MRTTRVWRRVLGVEHTVIESVDLQSDGRGDEVLVARVRVKAGQASRCSRCRRRCGRYGAQTEQRRWRGLDLGSTRVYLEADTERVSCPEHGVVVAHVPWARPGARFTTAFEDTTAWLVCHATLTMVAVLLRIAWRSVSAIVTRVVADRAGQVDRLAGLRRIGIDEISYRKGHRYLLVVIDHDTGRLVWAGKGRNADTLRAFFDDLGGQRAAALTHVTADGAEWIHDVVAERAPRAVLCLDTFHVVAWATKALDELRRRTAAQLRRGGHPDAAAAIKHTRWALIKNPENLTTKQRVKLAQLSSWNNQLYRGYLIKEQLREVFKAGADGGRGLLGELIGWSARSRIPEFVKLGRTLRRYQRLIINTLQHALSNALSEATIIWSPGVGVLDVADAA